MDGDFRFLASSNQQRMQIPPAVQTVAPSSDKSLGQSQDPVVRREDDQTSPGDGSGVLQVWVNCGGDWSLGLV